MSSLTHPPLPAHRSESCGSAAAGAGGTFGLLWLTWRQHRWAVLGSLLIAAMLTGWMAYLAADMTTLYHQCHDVVCALNSPQYATLHAPYGPIRISTALLLVVRYSPLLIGACLGVPLLTREHEQRTLLLAWSQDVSPLRWLCTKLTLLGVFVAALSAAVSGVSDHLSHVLTAIGDGNMWSELHFLDSWMLPLASGVCWFAAGVALGATIKRTLPALLAVVAGFFGLTLGVQSHYTTLMTPLTVSIPYGSADFPGSASALIINDEVAIPANRPSNLYDSPSIPSNLYGSSGHELGYTELNRMCPNIGNDPDPFACLVRNHLQTHVTYQPASRLPDFHLILNLGYLGLAAVTLAAAWFIVRRTSLSAG